MIDMADIHIFAEMQCIHDTTGSEVRYKRATIGNYHPDIINGTSRTWLGLTGLNTRIETLKLEILAEKATNGCTISSQ